MCFTDTRSGNVYNDSRKLILQGIASSGGLFVPQTFPRFDDEEINNFVSLTYCEKAEKILSPYLLSNNETGYSKDELTAAINGAYNAETFASPDVTPVVPLDGNAYVLELWHGVSAAFKDVALQILPRLVSSAKKALGDVSKTVILVATSGDTGKAALEGFRDVQGTYIIVFYPETGVSDIQRLQMTTQQGSNVKVAGINGNFDDAQRMVKAIFTDTDYSVKLASSGITLSSANSINIGRLLPQIVYYFSGYCDLIKHGAVNCGDTINIVVPTGNFGNILAAYYAKLMGLPVNKLICASNRNNILTDFISTGLYDTRRQFFVTSSPSMDILVSSNLERFIYHMVNGDSVRVCAFMDKLKQDGVFSIDNDTLNTIKQNLWASYCGESQCAETIKQTYESSGYVADPHTAVAINVYNSYKTQTGDNSPTLVASTASPFKFATSVLSAIFGSAAVDSCDEFTLSNELSQRCKLQIPRAFDGLSEKPVRFTDSLPKDGTDIYKQYINSAIAL